MKLTQQHFCAPVSSEHWMRRSYHSSIVVGNRLYIDGGDITIGNESQADAKYPAAGKNYQNNCTLTIDLSSGFTPETATYNYFEHYPAKYNQPALWLDPTKAGIHSFGGEHSTLSKISPALCVWKLDLETGQWNMNISAQNDPFTNGMTRPSGGAWASTNDTAFYLGGYANRYTSVRSQSFDSNMPLPGLITYNFGNGTWTNTTTPTVSKSGTFFGGSMVHVPTMGHNGLIVVFGGDTSDLVSYTPGAQPRSMKDISLYDPVTRVWYSQTATGDQIPSARSQFCTVVARDPSMVQGAKNGTYEIYMYGGWNGSYGPGQEEFDEIWALTLPAFRWVLVDSSRKRSRIGHSCNLIGKRQLLSIGGIDPSQPTQEDAYHGPDFINGLGVYDLTASNWTNEYEPSAAEYRRPEAINHVYVTDSSYPRTWNQPALKSLILDPKPIQVQPALTTGIIAAIVISIVSILILLSSLTFYLIRRRRIRNANNAPLEIDSEKNLWVQLPSEDDPVELSGCEGSTNGSSRLSTVDEVSSQEERESSEGGGQSTGKLSSISSGWYSWEAGDDSKGVGVVKTLSAADNVNSGCGCGSGVIICARRKDRASSI